MNRPIGPLPDFCIMPVVFGLILLLGGSAFAADGAKGPAYTEPPADDENYPLLGEFIGPIETGENEYAPLGLQVRPVGGDNFEAVQFTGGLPGQEKHDPEGVKMVGRRSGDFVVLSGGPWAIFVEKDRCLILDRNGKRVGQLERVSRQSPTLGAQPPEGAIVLFDGTSTDQFTNAEMTDDGLLMQGADIKPMFQDFDLHLEFLLPYMPTATSQGRANSGIYVQSRYECQVLDSFGQDRLINGCGALYQFRKPDLNMCFPPLVWQTYDIRFTAPRWAADGSKIRNAHITAWLNGVKVQDNVELPNKTGAGKPEEPVLLPTRLQDHGDPVRFRNAWVIDRGLTSGVEFPVQGGEGEPQASAPAAEEAPAEETPAEETPAEETPAEETPAEETPAEETPAEETPAEETPAEETPAEQDTEQEESSAVDAGSTEEADAESGPGAEA